MPEHSCAVNGNHLVVHGDFSTDADTGFDDACQKLLSVEGKDLVADLTGATYICSTYVGLLLELCLGAKARGKKLTVRAGSRIASTLRDAGLESAATLEEVGGGP